MGKYWAFYKVGLQETLTYRGPMVIWLLGNIISLVMMVALWLAVDTTGTIGSYTKNELITYYILSLGFQWLIGWYPFTWVKEEIKSGEIVGAALLKPSSYYLRGFMREAAWHSISVFLGLISAFVFYLIFQGNFVLPAGPSSLLLLVPALILAIFVVYSANLCVGLVAFWFTQVDALGDVFWAILGIFGGFLVPLTFMPQSFQLLVKIAPFRYMFSFPMEIYFQKISTMETLSGFLIASVWVAIFVYLYKVLWQRGSRAYTAWGQ